MLSPRHCLPKYESEWSYYYYLATYRSVVFVDAAALMGHADLLCVKNNQCLALVRRVEPAVDNIQVLSDNTTRLRSF